MEHDYTAPFEAAGLPVPEVLAELTKKYERIERLAEGGHLAALDIMATEAAQITQKVKHAAAKDLEAKEIAQVWSQRRPTGWASYHDRGWAGDLERAARQAFAENAPALIEARKAEFSEAAEALAAVILAIGAEPDPGAILSEADPEAVRAYQHREATAARLTAIREWRRTLATMGYSEPEESVAWWLAPQSAGGLSDATEIWEQHEGDPFPRLLEAGFSLSLNTEEQAQSLTAAHQAAEEEKRQQTEAARPLTEAEIRREFTGRQEVLAHQYGSLSKAPVEEKRALQEWLEQELAKAKEGVWAI